MNYDKANELMKELKGDQKELFIDVLHSVKIKHGGVVVCEDCYHVYAEHDDEDVYCQRCGS